MTLDWPNLGAFPLYLRKISPSPIIFQAFFASLSAFHMKNKSKRPISIWIAQILISIPTLLFFALALMQFVAMLGSLSSGRALLLIIPILFILGFAFLFSVSIWGMAKRRTYGRWLGVVSLSLMMLFSLAGQLIQPAGPMEYYQYKNSAERFGGFVGAVIMFGLFLWLILHIAFAKSVAAFFSPTESPLSSLPPPPPSFEHTSELHSDIS